MNDKRLKALQAMGRVFDEILVAHVEKKKSPKVEEVEAEVEEVEEEESPVKLAAEPKKSALPAWAVKKE